MLDGSVSTTRRVNASNLSNALFKSFRMEQHSSTKIDCCTLKSCVAAAMSSKDLSVFVPFDLFTW